MPFTDPIIQNPATNSWFAAVGAINTAYQGSQFFPQGVYTITVATGNCTVKFYSGVTLVASITTTGGTGTVTLPTSADSAAFATDSAASITITLVGLPISPINNIGTAKPVVTGGTLTSDATYYYRTFLATGNLVVTTNIYAGALTCDVLVVAGGGGGGGSSNAGFYAAGGGAGGLLSFVAQALAGGSYTATIGVGGIGGVTVANGVGTQGGNGQDSQFGALTLVKGGGGGGGGGDQSAINLPGKAGGSGGGGNSTSGAGGVATPAGQGNAGATGVGTFQVTTQSGGGGGGAGAVGGTPADNSHGGIGGDGSSAFSAWGLATGTGQNVGGTYYYAGGAGGNGNTAGGAGGKGGGAAGGINTGAAGTANTGGGGSALNAGGSGIIIVRYLKTAV
jgi:hypothetical protein